MGHVGQRISMRSPLPHLFKLTVRYVGQRGSCPTCPTLKNPVWDGETLVMTRLSHLSHRNVGQVSNAFLSIVPSGRLRRETLNRLPVREDLAG